MRVTVYLLRQRGRRLRDHQHVEGIAGKLQLETVLRGSESHPVVRLRAQVLLSSQTTDLLPPLYAPQLAAIGRDSFLLRGFEADDDAGHVQEWHCAVG